ncbi:hypothetical protein HETIRDRAFT_470895 [Heterobasidion irregulare TC 32-1]|uniref:Phospholipid scramblase n=1 Tax=Heterobasidion irregulare (strain TC 32-1) TaxID=747525 RepID=W4KIR4_HETIT|nr:uncharacterized protein HETIRDRAFT_470895 [Heterobasidion irregulare TC 32-1]ETW85743.1 hypothetical protein HETIRDRAFT_470895 [Heterobasidion irregulare TC 32-1]
MNTSSLHRPFLSPWRALGAPPSIYSRKYALSRFPDRKPGVGRFSSKRGFKQESDPSTGETSLWKESQRRPVGHSEEGIKRLLLGNNTLTVTRQLEMLNIFIGFEQANKYTISNESGEPLGFIAEEPRGFLSTFSRQIFRTHRPFRAIIMDHDGTPILWIRRPFDWINSRMFVSRLKDLHEYTVDKEPVLDTFAEVQQRWHLWRRRYDLFLRDTPHRILSAVDEPQPEPELDTEHFSQFSRIDEGLWAWHFNLRDERGQEIATINRAFRGFGREIFTDTGQYSIDFAPRPATTETSVLRTLNLEERAVILAMAVNVDFDYFSRHSEGGHGMGLPFFFGGGE